MADHPKNFGGAHGYSGPRSGSYHHIWVYRFAHRLVVVSRAATPRPSPDNPKRECHTGRVSTRKRHPHCGPLFSASVAYWLGSREVAEAKNEMVKARQETAVADQKLKALLEQGPDDLLGKAAQKYPQVFSEWK